MRIILLIAVFISCCTVSVAQYVPSSNQGYQYMALYNPAFNGIESFTDIKLSYLSQWGNVPGAPKTINLTFAMRLNKQVDLSNSSLRPSAVSAYTNPDLIPRKKRFIHAIGANVFNQTYGPMTVSGAGVSYAFHYPVSRKIRLAGGIAGVAESIKIDPSITFRDSGDPYVSYLQSNNAKQTNLNIRAGAVLYGNNFYLGVSYLPVYNESIGSRTANTISSHPFYRGSFQAGYAFPLSSNVTLKPSVLGLLQVSGGVSVDYNVKAYIQNKIMIGAGYRDIQSAAFYLGFNISERLGVTYSYELSVNGFKQFNDGSHELVLALRLNNYKKVNPYLW